MSSQLTVVEVFNNQVEAEIAKGHLEASGIEAFVSKDDCGGTYPAMQLTRGVRLLVSSSDVEKAKEILRLDLHEGSEENRHSAEAEKWRCRGCGEILEGQFSECWQCGSSRPQGS